MNGIADLLFLIVMRVVTVVPAQDYGSGQLRMPEFTMRSLAAWKQNKARPLQVGNQLADFARHMQKFAIR